ncbi:MAG: hemolysin family protein [Parvularculaceae bacterium]
MTRDDEKRMDPWRRIRAALRNKNGGAPETLAEAIENGAADGEAGLSASRREMIERVIAFDQKRVDDVMAPRADITAVDIDTPLPGLIHAFSEAGHSRLPIIRGDLDDPVGMVHLKDVIELMADAAAPPPPNAEPATAEGSAEPTEGAESPLLGLRRDILYVPPSMRVTDLLLKMQAARIHLALVIDEYGGTDGLVTIEDLVQEIVGEIQDEHDEDDAPTISPAGSGDCWEADARGELEEVSEETGFDLTLEDDEVDTLGGLAVALAGRVPQRGEVLAHPAGFELEIAGADPRKVRKVTIRRGDGSVSGSLRAESAGPDAPAEAAE